MTTQTLKLPTWKECEAVILKSITDKDAPKPSALQLFIYAHDDADPERSDRFLGELSAVIKEALAQPEQEQNLKLMPREATPEMLKAMDECSMEGYDERLYACHAGSVYMAAWDAFHGQHCYCGDITNLGVIHRDDGPCHYPEHKEPEHEIVAYGMWDTMIGCAGRMMCVRLDKGQDGCTVPLCTIPPQRKLLTDELNKLRKALVYVAHALHATPQYMLAKGIALIDGDTVQVSIDGYVVEASDKTIEAAHGIKEDA